MDAGPSPAAAVLFDRTIVADAHGDIYELNHLLNQGVERPLAREILPRLRTAGVDVLTLAVGGDSFKHSNNIDLPLLGTLSNIARLRREVAAADGAVAIIRTAEDIPTQPDGVFRYVLTLEGARCLSGSLDVLEILHALDLRSIELVWNYRNELGDGAMEGETGGGLSRFGRDVIRSCERLGILVDLAHATPATFWQSLEVADRPVIVSHANASAVCPHPRNLGDDQIRAIAEQGGFVGVQRSPGRVHPTHPTLARFVDHVCHMIDLVGPEHVGIGLDFNKPSGPAHHKDRRFATSEVKHISGFEELDNLRDVAAELLARGVSERHTAGVMGGNFMRVLASALEPG